MKFEQAAILLELARNAILEIEGVFSVRTSLQTDEFIVHVTEEIFNTISGDVIVEYEPEGLISNFGLSKRNGGIKFNMLLEPKKFHKLYPDYRKGEL